MADIVIDKSRNKKIITRHGASFALNILVKNNDGSSYDFTGHTVTFEIFRGPSDRSAELIFSTGSGLTLSIGLIALSKTLTQMAALRLKSYVYYLWVTFPDGTKKLWLNGQFSINKEEYDAPSSSPETITVTTASDTLSITVEAAGFSLENLTPSQLQQLATSLIPYLV